MGGTDRQNPGRVVPVSDAPVSRPLRTPAGGRIEPSSRKTILSFYCDDTNPCTAGAGAFRVFLDYCATHGVRGEASAILGMGGHSMCRQTSAEEKVFLRELARAWESGIDTHMELMTHGTLFDFDANRVIDRAGHEGLWLHEPDITLAQYRRYFESILQEGERVGISFTGLTWPGCGCDVCGRRYAELRAGGYTAPNPEVWTALVELAEQGRFRGKTIPCFFGSSETDGHLHLKAGHGKYGVYDLMPNANDYFGIWENNPDRVNADYYITEDGEKGIIVEHVRKGDPYCIWYGHWQGLNPVTGVGWPAFTTVVDRIDKHLHDRVVWRRPSEITDCYHAAGGWHFPDSQEPPMPCLE